MSLFTQAEILAHIKGVSRTHARQRQLMWAVGSVRSHARASPPGVVGAGGQVPSSGLMCRLLLSHTVTADPPTSLPDVPDAATWRSQNPEFWDSFSRFFRRFLATP